MACRIQILPRSIVGGLLAGLLVMFIADQPLAAAGAPPDDRARAREILDVTGFQGGLIVHLGCGEGRLTTALRQESACLVRGLDSHPNAVAAARSYIRQRGVYGPVSVDRLEGRLLPLAANVVNLMVVDDPQGVSNDEIMRVLVPGGVAYARQKESWTKTIKPNPDNTDEWTHYLHDAGGNAVSHDTAVGPPRYVQWIAEPRFTRSHEHAPSINSVVSANGRLFYIVDQAPIASIRQPARWYLVARDAYNGLLLWKQPIDSWFPVIVNWGVTPRQLQRKLVAVGNRVYVTLGLHAPLSELDAATGKTLQVYDNTRGAEEIVLHRGVMLLVVRAVTPERSEQLVRWAELASQDNSPLFQRETAESFVNRWRAAESKAARSLVAVDVKTGKLLWKKSGQDLKGIRTGSLCADGDGVFYQGGNKTFRLDLMTGEEQWSASTGTLRLVHGGAVVCAGGKTVQLLSAKTGQPLWTAHPTLTEIRDAFVANGSLWLGGFKPIENKRGPAWGPYFATERDLKTGKVLKEVTPENPGHHHRCYANKATDRYILAGRRGVEFIDLKTGDLRWNSWVRGVCKYGVMPANGLLYAPPNACGCYVAAKLEGFFALASQAHAAATGSASERVLETGPAYDQGERLNVARTGTSRDWPTYRHDSQRSGSTAVPVPATLRQRWQTHVGVAISSPTIANGTVFVACPNEHTITALAADSGEARWQFTAGARVDSPPTLYQDQVIFGSHDGWIYNLIAEDGRLSWRLRAARRERQIVAHGQLESASPVRGSVLIRNGVIYATAGRSSYLDGGIDLCRIQPRTGKVLSTTSIYSPDPETGKQPPQFGPSAMPGALPDILSSDEEYVYLRDSVYDLAGTAKPSGNPHLLTLTGFLDNSWAHRSYWIFGTKCSLSTGCSGRDRKLIYGRLLVFDDSTIYGYGRQQVHWSNQLRDGPYRMFAVKRGENSPIWTKALPVQIRTMVLAGDVLFAAGPQMLAGSQPPVVDEDRPALLTAVSARDGALLAQYPLAGHPVFDGMAAAGGRLYISLENGQLVCLDKPEHAGP